MTASAELLTTRSFRIRLPGEGVMEVHSRGFTRGSDGSVTWVGTLGNGETLQVLTGDKYGVVGRINVNERAYYIEPVGEGWHLISEIIEDAFGRNLRDVEGEAETAGYEPIARKGSRGG